MRISGDALLWKLCVRGIKSMRKDSDNAKLLEPGELPSKRKVLVVEDNELNRDILSSFWKRNLMFFRRKRGRRTGTSFRALQRIISSAVGYLYACV